VWSDEPELPFKTKNTPERIEYFTESEMEESEFEQTKHNRST